MALGVPVAWAGLAGWGWLSWVSGPLRNSVRATIASKVRMAAQTIIAAAILRHLHAVITTGQAWDPVIATHGTRRNPGTLAA